MAFEGLPAYAFTAEGVLEGAPEDSGIYAIFTPTHWVFIGDADDMRGALFDHLNTPRNCIDKYHPLSFSCEVVSRRGREVQRDALIAELRPTCNEFGGTAA